MSRHGSRISCKAHKVYKLTCDEYDEMWEACGGNCTACGRAIDLTKNDHAIDHDHRYGVTAVRGIVCFPCNQYLWRLENPQFHPAFGRGPGRWFKGYFERAWFMRNRRESKASDDLVDHEQIRSEMRDWVAHNKALYSANPKAVLVRTDKPSEIAKTLRAEMSPQAFANLVRILNREAETPKKLPPWLPHPSASTSGPGSS